MVRGIRGATTVKANEKPLINEAVRELLSEIEAVNGLKKEDVAAAIFSSTPDLNAAFPATGARLYGWDMVPLFGTVEMEIATGVPYCIRVLILWNTEIPPAGIKHVYLHQAAELRRDIIK